MLSLLYSMSKYDRLEYSKDSTTLNYFYNRYKNTGYQNIGSVINPIQYKNACLCNEDMRLSAWIK